MAVDGTYSISMKTPLGQKDFKLTLKSEGNSLSGDFTSEAKIVKFKNGTADGNNYKFKCSISMIPATFEGKVEGDVISGFAKSPVANMGFTGNRV